MTIKKKKDKQSGGPSNGPLPRKWTLKEFDRNLTKTFANQMGVSPLVAALLHNRNIRDISQAKLFLEPALNRLHSPFLLPDMEKAVVRVRQAIDQNEKILVYGDRDVDGVTSTALIVRMLKNLGAEVLWKVPGDEGYGLSSPVLEKFKNEDVRLVITVDCGTSAVEEIDFANSIGLDVIVTDHHLPPDRLPDAFAIVNPNLKNSVYPDKGMAGCLTAFKFAYAVMCTFSRTFNQEFVVLDLETTGLSAQSSEIVEIGAILIKNFIPIGKFHSLIHPEQPIPIQATAIHGINNEMVEDSPHLEDVLPKLKAFIGERPIVAHNAKFDLSFLKVAYDKTLKVELNNSYIDTLALSRECFSFPSHSLTSLVRELGIEVSTAHRAMDDCLATVSLFAKAEEKRDPRLQSFIEDNLDLATLGTIADIVPLLGENRVIVKHGLAQLFSTKKVGLGCLLDGCGVKSRIKVVSSEKKLPSARDVAFQVAPFLNAAGRFSKAHLAVELLLTENWDEAKSLVSEIVQLNTDRRGLQKSNFSKFSQAVQEQCDVENDKILFVVLEGIEHGVTGIIASQLMQEYNRPAILLISDGKTATGSCRSVPSFNVVTLLKRLESYLVKYGGHPAAAGLTVEIKNIDLLRKQIKSIAQKEITQDDLTPILEIEADLEAHPIGLDIVYQVKLLEPFGQGNPTPCFCLRGIEIADLSLVGTQKNHLKLQLIQNGQELDAIGWGMHQFSKQISKGTKIDVAFTLESNGWNGQLTPQLVLKDILPSRPDPENNQELFIFQENEMVLEKK